MGPAAFGNGGCFPMRMDFLNELLAAVEHSAPPIRFTKFTALLGLWLLLWVLGRVLPKKGSGEDAARKITEEKRKLYSAPHEYAPVRVHDFRWLDARYYDETQRLLESIGFKCFGDVENLSLTAVFPNMRTAIRDLASGDGVVSASVWHFKVRGWLRVLALLRLLKDDLRVVDLGTEFSDGTFLATANNLGLDPSSDVPGIERIQLLYATPIEDALVGHRRRVAEILAQRPGVAPVLARTGRDVREAAARAHALKCGENARNNFVDLQQFAGAAAQTPLLAKNQETRAMAQELARIRDGVSQTTRSAQPAESRRA